MTSEQIITVELEGRTYTINLTPTSINPTGTAYTICGARGGTGKLVVTRVGTMKIFGIERLARRGRKIACTLEGIMPGVKSSVTINGDEQARRAERITMTRATAERLVRQGAKAKDERERARRRANRPDPIETTPTRHLHLVHSA